MTKSFKYANISCKKQNNFKNIYINEFLQRLVALKKDGRKPDQRFAQAKMSQIIT